MATHTLTAQGQGSPGSQPSSAPASLVTLVAPLASLSPCFLIHK